MIPVITTLAEYQTRFWLLVAEELAASGFQPQFVSFDDRSTEMLRAGNWHVVSANEIGRLSPDLQEQIFTHAGIAGLPFWTSHERFAFGRRDDASMREKLARSFLAAETALNQASSAGVPVIVQELGGFLSVIGAWFAANAANARHLFIEPSFFRGRLLFKEDDFSAAKFPRELSASGGDEFDRYLSDTLEKGAIVIPKKDAHHYTAAWRKVANLRNLRRLIEKSVDKHLLGKRQEFGFIGQHVFSHVRMTLSSSRLRKHYSQLNSLGRFVYFPLHVPGDVALTVRSPEYLDQLGLLDFICRTLPDGMQLAVKEHPAMVGMLQPARVVEMIRRYPHFRLIDPATNNFSVMRNAEAVVTINSKSGAEAGLLNRPVFVLGDAFYRDAPFAEPLARRAEIPAALSRLAAGRIAPAAPEAVRRWFAGVWNSTAPGELYVTDPAGAKIFANSLGELLRGDRRSCKANAEVELDVQP
jgi:hypothetical protein